MTHTKKHYLLVALQIVVALILFALFLSLYKYTEHLLISESSDRASRDIERIQLNIQRDMQAAESAAHSFCALQFDNGKQLPQDSSAYYELLRKFLANTTSTITGAIIGFEDGVFPQFEAKHGFLPLVRHVNGTYRNYQMGTVRDVRTQHDWYRETKRLNRSRWAQPQLAEEGEVICGYCIPLHNDKDEFIGVLEIDFSIERLSAEVCRIRSYEHSEPMIVDSDLTVLIAPEKDIVLKETMPTLLERRGLVLESEVLQSVKRRATASHHLHQGTFENPHEVFLYHCYDPYSGWTIQMTCLAEDVTKSLTALKLRMAVIAITILGLILLVALTFMRHGDH